MPTATLEFDLGEPDDSRSLWLALRAPKMRMALDEIREELRRTLKYDELSSEKYEMLARVSKRFYDILSENNIDLDG